MLDEPEGGTGGGSIGSGAVAVAAPGKLVRAGDGGGGGRGAGGVVEAAFGKPAGADEVSGAGGVLSQAAGLLDGTGAGGGTDSPLEVVARLVRRAGSSRVLDICPDDALRGLTFSIGQVDAGGVLRLMGDGGGLPCIVGRPPGIPGVDRDGAMLAGRTPGVLPYPGAG